MGVGNFVQAGGSMSGRLVWVEDPPPKPVSAAKWVPAAAKHKLNICWDVQCVGTPAGHAHPVTSFWGGSFAARDVGACVMAVVAEIEGCSKGVTP